MSGVFEARFELEAIGLNRQSIHTGMLYKSFLSHLFDFDFMRFIFFGSVNF